MRIIEAPCRVCKKPARAVFDDKDADLDVLKDAVDKFLPLLTHDACYDRMDKRNTAGRAIQTLCESWRHLNIKERSQAKTKIRENLLIHARRYAEAMWETYTHTRVAVSEGDVTNLTDTLLDRPEKMSEILKAYRAEIWRASASYRRKPEPEPAPEETPQPQPEPETNEMPLEPAAA